MPQPVELDTANLGFLDHRVKLALGDVIRLEWITEPFGARDATLFREDEAVVVVGETVPHFDFGLVLSVSLHQFYEFWRQVERPR